MEFHQEVTQLPDFRVASRTESFRFLVPIPCGMPLPRNVGVVGYKVSAFGRSHIPHIVA